jgi:hypothetical protein
MTVYQDASIRVVLKVMGFTWAEKDKLKQDIERYYGSVRRSVLNFRNLLKEVVYGQMKGANLSFYAGTFLPSFRNSLEPMVIGSDLDNFNALIVDLGIKV